MGHAGFCAGGRPSGVIREGRFLPRPEGLASHGGPESCVGGRKDVDEVLTGVRAGRTLSHEITGIGAPTLLCQVEGNTNGGDSASRAWAPRGRRTLHARNLHAREPGDPVFARRPRSGRRAAQGRLRPQA